MTSTSSDRYEPARQHLALVLEMDAERRRLGRRLTFGEKLAVLDRLRAARRRI